MGTLIEGLEAARQPCTLALVLPALGLILLTGHRAALAAIGFILGAAAVAWGQAAGVATPDPQGPAMLFGALVLAAVVASALLIRHAGAPTLGGTALGGTALGGIALGGVIGWLWQPCAGPRLAAILNDASGAPVRTLWLMTVYVAGACMPAVMLAALPEAMPGLGKYRDHRAIAAAGAAITAVFATMMAIGRYDDMVAELVRRTTG